MRIVPFLPALILLACRGSGDPDSADGPERATGSVSVCPSRDTGDAWGFEGDLTGTVIEESTAGFTPLAQGECSGENVDHAVTIEVEDGTRYAIGWRIHDADGEDVTPALGLTPGEAVGLHLDQACGEGCGNAFSVTRDDVLVGAVSDGVWDTTLAASATPGLSVSRGAEGDEFEVDCGTLAAHRLVFAGDTSVDLLPYATGSVAIGGRPYTAFAIDASVWVRPACTDMADSLAWAAFADR